MLPGKDRRRRLVPAVNTIKRKVPEQTSAHEVNVLSVQNQSPKISTVLQRISSPIQQVSSPVHEIASLLQKISSPKQKIASPLQKEVASVQKVTFLNKNIVSTGISDSNKSEEFSVSAQKTVSPIQKVLPFKKSFPQNVMSPVQTSNSALQGNKIRRENVHPQLKCYSPSQKLVSSSPMRQTSGAGKEHSSEGNNVNKSYKIQHDINLGQPTEDNIEKNNSPLVRKHSNVGNKSDDKYNTGRDHSAVKSNKETSLQIKTKFDVKKTPDGSTKVYILSPAELKTLGINLNTLEINNTSKRSRTKNKASSHIPSEGETATKSTSKTEHTDVKKTLFNKLTTKHKTSIVENKKSTYDVSSPPPSCSYLNNSPTKKIQEDHNNIRVQNKPPSDLTNGESLNMETATFIKNYLIFSPKEEISNYIEGYKSINQNNKSQEHNIVFNNTTDTVTLCVNSIRDTSAGDAIVGSTITSKPPGRNNLTPNRIHGSVGPSTAIVNVIPDNDERNQKHSNLDGKKISAEDEYFDGNNESLEIVEFDSDEDVDFSLLCDDFNTNNQSLENIDPLSNIDNAEEAESFVKYNNVNNEEAVKECPVSCVENIVQPSNVNTSNSTEAVNLLTNYKNIEMLFKSLSKSIIVSENGELLPVSEYGIGQCVQETVKQIPDNVSDSKSPVAQIKGNKDQINVKNKENVGGAGMKSSMVNKSNSVIVNSSQHKMKQYMSPKTLKLNSGTMAGKMCGEQIIPSVHSSTQLDQLEISKSHEPPHDNHQNVKSSSVIICKKKSGDGKQDSFQDVHHSPTKDTTDNSAHVPIDKRADPQQKIVEILKEFHSSNKMKIVKSPCSNRNTLDVIQNNKMKLEPNAMYGVEEPGGSTTYNNSVIVHPMEAGQLSLNDVPLNRKLNNVNVTEKLSYGESSRNIDSFSDNCTPEAVSELTGSSVSSVINTIYSSYSDGERKMTVPKSPICIAENKTLNRSISLQLEYDFDGHLSSNEKTPESLDTSHGVHISDEKIHKGNNTTDTSTSKFHNIKTYTRKRNKIPDTKLIDLPKCAEESQVINIVHDDVSVGVFNPFDNDDVGDSLSLVRTSANSTVLEPLSSKHETSLSSRNVFRGFSDDETLFEECKSNKDNESQQKLEEGGTVLESNSQGINTENSSNGPDSRFNENIPLEDELIPAEASSIPEECFNLEINGIGNISALDKCFPSLNEFIVPDMIDETAHNVEYLANVTSVHNEAFNDVDEESNQIIENQMDDVGDEKSFESLIEINSAHIATISNVDELRKSNEDTSVASNDDNVNITLNNEEIKNIVKCIPECGDDCNQSIKKTEGNTSPVLGDEIRNYDDDLCNDNNSSAEDMSIDQTNTLTEASDMSEANVSHTNACTFTNTSDADTSKNSSICQAPKKRMIARARCDGRSSVARKGDETSMIESEENQSVKETPVKKIKTELKDCNSSPSRTQSKADGICVKKYVSQRILNKKLKNLDAQETPKTRKRKNEELETLTVKSNKKIKAPSSNLRDYKVKKVEPVSSDEEIPLSNIVSKKTLKNDKRISEKPRARGRRPKTLTCEAKEISELEEGSEQENVGETEPGEPTTTLRKDEVKCGVCSQVVKNRQWNAHNLNKHYNLAWIDGQTKLDMTDQSLLTSLLNKALKSLKRLKCALCSDTKASAVGYISHINTCQKTPEEIEAYKILCTICNMRIFPSSFPYHLSKHAQENQKPEKVLDISTLSDTKTKRKAATAAEDMFKKIGSEVSADNADNLFNKGCTPRMTKRLETIWNTQIQLDNKAMCTRKFCSHTESNIQDMTEHYLSTCPYIVKKPHVCRVCRYQCEAEESMLEHIQSQHPGADSGKPESEAEDFDGDDLSSESNDYDDSDSSSDNSRKVARPKHFNATSKSSKSSSVGSISGLEGSFRFSFDPQKCNEITLRKGIVPWMDLIKQKIYCGVGLFPEYVCNEFIVISDDEMESYLPIDRESCNVSHINDTGDNVSSIQWCKYKLFQSEITNGAQTFWCGGSIHALDYLPCLYDNAFVAVAATSSLDDRYRDVESHAHKGLLQIWDLGCLNNKDHKCLTPASMVFSIVHEHGVVWDLSWCPSGCNDYWPDENWTSSRMGLLAIACSNGQAYLYAICHPDTLPYRDIKIWKTDPVVELRLSSGDCDESMLGGVQYQATKICWSQDGVHNIIAVGYSNGIVAYFNILTKSSLLKSKCGNTSIIFPYKVFQAYSSKITGLILLPQFVRTTDDSALVVTSHTGCNIWRGDYLTYSRPGGFNGAALPLLFPEVIGFSDDLQPAYARSYSIPLGISTGSDTKWQTTEEGCQVGCLMNWSSTLYAASYRGQVTRRAYKSPFISRHRSNKSGMKKRLLCWYTYAVDLNSESFDVSSVRHQKEPKTNKRGAKPVDPDIPESVASYKDTTDKYGVIIADVQPFSARSKDIFLNVPNMRMWPLWEQLCIKNSLNETYSNFAISGSRAGFCRNVYVHPVIIK